MSTPPPAPAPPAAGRTSAPTPGHPTQASATAPPTTTGHAADAAFLQRIERTAIAFIVIATIAGAIFGGWVWAGGIFGGGLLAGISYWAIRSSVDALVALMGPPRPTSVDAGEDSAGAEAAVETPRVSRARLAVSVLGRHALLGLVAWFIIARLRLHPVGVLVGASAVVLAAAREALRGPALGSRS